MDLVLSLGSGRRLLAVEPTSSCHWVFQDQLASNQATAMKPDLHNLQIESAVEVALSACP